MTTQPPTDPPARPSINQASRRYRGGPGRNVTPSPRPSPSPAAASSSAAPPSEPCPDQRRHDRRVQFLHRLRYVAITLALMVATGATVALICSHG
ncbi:hypothetical protein [Catenuloplanes atrovinosus]|uniref:Uncharacterized protein n=1 Tax=Catenuloplanes atrovinosus TaxID=137266 RepID=A0AAE4CEW3_9ACTN|nr:hypothetical protein [Catenuloplanes atrovinosus]MDR7279030.1 hypothetical protein [Catenuloplanes atrovinosus]